jgi:hypothetical protein
MQTSYLFKFDLVQVGITLTYVSSLFFPVYGILKYTYEEKLVSLGAAARRVRGCILYV